MDVRSDGGKHVGRWTARRGGSLELNLQSLNGTVDSGNLPVRPALNPVVPAQSLQRSGGNSHGLMRKARAGRGGGHKPRQAGKVYSFVVESEFSVFHLM